MSKYDGRVDIGTEFLSDKLLGSAVVDKRGPFSPDLIKTLHGGANKINQSAFRDWTRRMEVAVNSWGEGIKGPCRDNVFPVTVAENELHNIYPDGLVGGRASDIETCRTLEMSHGNEIESIRVGRSKDKDIAMTGSEVSGDHCTITSEFDPDTGNIATSVVDTSSNGTTLLRWEWEKVKPKGFMGKPELQARLVAHKLKSGVPKSINDGDYLLLGTKLSSSTYSSINEVPLTERKGLLAISQVKRPNGVPGANLRIMQLSGEPRSEQAHIVDRTEAQAQAIKKLRTTNGAISRVDLAVLKYQLRGGPVLYNRFDEDIDRLERFFEGRSGTTEPLYGEFNPVPMGDFTEHLYYPAIQQFQRDTFGRRPTFIDMSKPETVKIGRAGGNADIKFPTKTVSSLHGEVRVDETGAYYSASKDKQGNETLPTNGATVLRIIVGDDGLGGIGSEDRIRHGNDNLRFEAITLEPGKSIRLRDGDLIITEGTHLWEESLSTGDRLGLNIDDVTAYLADPEKQIGVIAVAMIRDEHKQSPKIKLTPSLASSDLT